MNEPKGQAVDWLVQVESKPGRDQRLENARMLVSRLERLSADSYWAHQASGLRGSLLRSFEQVRISQATDAEGYSQEQAEKLDRLIDRGFEILVLAAQELHGT